MSSFDYEKSLRIISGELKKYKIICSRCGTVCEGYGTKGWHTNTDGYTRFGPFSTHCQYINGQYIHIWGMLVEPEGTIKVTNIPYDSYRIYMTNEE